MLAVMLKMNDEIAKQRVTLHNSIMNCALLECSSKLCMDVTSIERFGTPICNPFFLECHFLPKKVPS